MRQLSYATPTAHILIKNPKVKSSIARQVSKHISRYECIQDHHHFMCVLAPRQTFPLASHANMADQYPKQAIKTQEKNSSKKIH